VLHFSNAPCRTFQPPLTTVANGVLQSTGGKGYLRTEESFRDFELALEARVYDRDGGRGNSGVYIRSQPHADQGAEYPPAYEVQIDHGDDNNPTGSIYNRHQAIATNLKDGEWFRMRIRAVVQQHHKTGVCEFRDIRIRRL
jgi:hypothetical protein